MYLRRAVELARIRVPERVGGGGAGGCAGAQGGNGRKRVKGGYV